MKALFLMFCLLASTSLIGQSRLMDKEGKVTFFSEAPIENIDATTEQALAVLDTATNKVAVSISIKGFNFEKDLMQEHFNENYLESDKYPKATFAGELTQKIDYNSTETQKIPVKGKITIHGVTKPFEGLVNVDVSKSDIKVSIVFNVAVADFDIEIPTIVFNNIAEVVEVKSNFVFKK